MKGPHADNPPNVAVLSTTRIGATKRDRWIKELDKSIEQARRFGIHHRVTIPIAVAHELIAFFSAIAGGPR